MKTVVMVIAEKDFRDEEYQGPKEVLEAAGIVVVTACTTIQQVKGKLGLKVVPDILVENINTDLVDGLIFVGGGGAEQYFNDPLAHNFALEAAQKGKVYGAICIGPSILANAGLLKNKKVTCYPSEVTNLTQRGAIYVNEPVVVDGKLVTANGPKAALKFGEAIVSLLKL
jgi:protease I